MAAVDAVLGVLAQPAGPQLRPRGRVAGPWAPAASVRLFGTAGLGYGDFFAAAVVGGISRPSAPRSSLAAAAMVVVTLAWQQLHLVSDVLPRTVPPALVLIGFEVHRRRARRLAAAAAG